MCTSTSFQIYQTSDPDVWPRLRPESEEGAAAQPPPELDAWRLSRPKSGEGAAAQRLRGFVELTGY